MSVAAVAQRTSVGADPGTRPARTVRLRWPAAAGWLFVATAIQLLRSPGVPTWRAVFGEDGGIFLTEAIARPGFGAVASPYQGYLQVAPRLVAAVVAALPVRLAALVLAVVSALVIALLALFVYAASATVFAQRRSRAALALLIVALPVGYDLNASATNLHWYLDFACCWAFLGRQRNEREVVAAALVAVLAALSDPLVALFLPLAGYRLARSWRTMRASLPGSKPLAGRCRLVCESLGVPALFSLALAAQLMVVVFRQAPGSFVQVDAAQLPDIYGLRIAGSLLFGDRLLPGLVRTVGSMASVGACVVVAALLVAGFSQRTRAHRCYGTVLVLLSLAWLAVPLLLRGTATLLDVDRLPLPGSRYTVVPLLLLASALLLAGEPTGRGSLRRAGPQPILALLLAAVVVTSFRLPAQRSEGPVWSESLAAARAVCVDSHGRPAQSGRSAAAPWGRAPVPGEVLVPVAPRSTPAPWSAVVPCSALTG